MLLLLNVASEITGNVDPIRWTIRLNNYRFGRKVPIPKLEARRHTEHQ